MNNKFKRFGASFVLAGIATMSATGIANAATADDSAKDDSTAAVSTTAPSSDESTSSDETKEADSTKDADANKDAKDTEKKEADETADATKEADADKDADADKEKSDDTKAEDKGAEATARIKGVDSDVSFKVKDADGKTIEIANSEDGDLELDLSKIDKKQMVTLELSTPGFVIHSADGVVKSAPVANEDGTVDENAELTSSQVLPLQSVVDCIQKMFSSKISATPQDIANVVTNEFNKAGLNLDARAVENTVLTASDLANKYAPAVNSIINNLKLPNTDVAGFVNNVIGGGKSKAAQPYYSNSQTQNIENNFYTAQAGSKEQKPMAPVSITPNKDKGEEDLAVGINGNKISFFVSPGDKIRLAIGVQERDANAKDTSGAIDFSKFQQNPSMSQNVVQGNGNYSGNHSANGSRLAGSIGGTAISGDVQGGAGVALADGVAAGAELVAADEGVNYGPKVNTGGSVADSWSVFSSLF